MSRQASHAGPEWLELAREGDWPFLLWSGGWAGVRVHVQRGCCGLNLPPTPKQGAPWLSYPLPQMLAQGEEGRVRFEMIKEIFTY